MGTAMFWQCRQVAHEKNPLGCAEVLMEKSVCVFFKDAPHQVLCKNAPIWLVFDTFLYMFPEAIDSFMLI